MLTAADDKMTESKSILSNKCSTHAHPLVQGQGQLELAGSLKC